MKFGCPKMKDSYKVSVSKLESAILLIFSAYHLS